MELKKKSLVILLQGCCVRDSMPAICSDFYDVTHLMLPEIANWNKPGIEFYLKCEYGTDREILEQRPLC